MPKLQGINHQRAIRAFQKAGFWITREGKHVTMSNGYKCVTIPRNNPIDALTMGTIIIKAGLSIDAFKKLL
ncbi:MAG: hypothetical protein HQK96_13505 [Nitrospirae bacterium]|nr:hypothetical protein [Nitrospirota bacterium]